MDWLTVIWSFIIGFIIGKFWSPLYRASFVLIEELNKAKFNNQQLNKEKTI